MRAELRWLQTNDFRSWDDFLVAERDPYDCSGWFYCGVGVPGDPAQEDFQFCASTPSVVSRIKQERRHLRLLMVEIFTHEGIERALRDFIAASEGNSWSEISAELRRKMYSEYESTKSR